MEDAGKIMRKILTTGSHRWLVAGAFLAATWVAISLIRTSQNQPVQGAADAGPVYQEGVHFQTIDPPIDLSEIVSAGSDSAPDSGTIVVSEFFWYGCPHCRYFEPLVEEWQTTFADDLVFEQVPVVWNEQTQLHASIYYLGLDSEDPEKLKRVLFDEIIELRAERNPSAQLEQLAEVLGQHGIDISTIDEQLKAPTIRKKVERANKLMRAAQVSSTPTLLIDYRWAILNSEETSDAGIFNVANFLIERARENRQ